MSIRRKTKRILWLLFALAGVLVLVFLPSVWGDLVYPLKYSDAIIQSAQEFGVPPTLVAGVIFTESHFNAQATSGVGARGLMQIMPATGGGIASNLGDKNYTPDKLYDPATNIRYGTYYLSELLGRYDNNVAAVCAAYNGGPGVAGRYLETGNSNIPLETQGFIVKVQRARDMYAKIYGDDLGSKIGERIRQPQPTTLWDKVFGRVFSK